jgi:hypothetical protein
LRGFKHVRGWRRETGRLAVTGHGTFREYTGNKLGVSWKKYP